MRHVRHLSHFRTGSVDTSEALGYIALLGAGGGGASGSITTRLQATPPYSVNFLKSGCGSLLLSVEWLVRRRELSRHGPGRGRCTSGTQSMYRASGSTQHRRNKAKCPAHKYNHLGRRRLFRLLGEAVRDAEHSVMYGTSSPSGHFIRLLIFLLMRTQTFSYISHQFS